MVASRTTRPGGKRYRYYTCSKAQKRGSNRCPSPSVPAGEIERFVVEQIRAIGRDPNLLAETIHRARTQTTERMAALDAERTALSRDLAKRHAEVAKLVQDAPDANVGGHATARLADRQEQIRTAENRLVEVCQEHGLGKELLDRRSVEQALATFDPVWETLSPKEQARVLELLIETIDYDGGSGNAAITYRPSGIETFATIYAQEVTCTA
jgi:site-specific DNA recombinase